MQLQLLLRLSESALVGDDGLHTACPFPSPRFITYFDARTGIYFGDRTDKPGHSRPAAVRPRTGNFGHPYRDAADGCQGD